MIDKKTCRLLGILAKTHGTDGSMLIRTKEQDTGILHEPDFVFVEVDGLLVPFAVSSLEPYGPREMIISLEEIAGANEAMQYSGNNIWISEDDMLTGSRSGSETDLRGYLVVDKHLGPLGTVADVLDISRNPLLSVIKGDKELLVPYHEDIILKIDKRKQIVSVDLPEGLTEI